ncbi:hypothetical protein F4780DRAFT_776998 [Xylariomycetidae sp. FL0641]|nr:hypothetical protein F4780DRAFT_776998 [Xylariomycetidae sp. FL0641]
MAATNASLVPVADIDPLPKHPAIPGAEEHNRTLLRLRGVSTSLTSGLLYELTRMVTAGLQVDLLFKALGRLATGGNLEFDEDDFDSDIREETPNKSTDEEEDEVERTVVEDVRDGVVTKTTWTFTRKGKQEKEAEADEHPKVEFAFAPFDCFFYGSLQVPAILRMAADLPEGEELGLRAGSVAGWKIMRWGPYPMLVPDPTTPSSSEIPGQVWRCETLDRVSRLGRYESCAYKLACVDVKLAAAATTGEVLAGCRTFVRAEEDEVLREGPWNLADFQAGKW